MCQNFFSITILLYTGWLSHLNYVFKSESSFTICSSNWLIDSFIQSRDFYGNLATGLLGRITWKSRKIWLRFHALLSRFAYNEINPSLLTHICFDFLFLSRKKIINRNKHRKGIVVGIGIHQVPERETCFPTLGWLENCNLKFSYYSVTLLNLFFLLYLETSQE